MGFIKNHPIGITGIAITLLFLLFAFIRLDLLDTLDLKLYDVMMNFRSSAGVDTQIVLVDIDDDSIEKLGRWPWPRSQLAEGIRKIATGTPRVIGLNIILSEAGKSAGVKELNRLKALFVRDVLPRVGEAGRSFIEEISAVEARLDQDGQLAEAIRQSGKVVLPVFLKESVPPDEGRSAVDDALAVLSIQNIRSPAGAIYPRSGEITLPLAEFLTPADGIGHINLTIDPDGTVRRERPVYEYNGVFIPSYTLKLVSAYLNVPVNKIRAHLGSSIYVGSVKIPLTVDSEILISFKGSAGSFKRYSYVDVLNDKVPLQLFKNKIVLISPSAAGIMNPLSTPVDARMPVGEYSANALWSILNNRFIRQPLWDQPAELLFVICCGLAITFLIPRLKALPAGLVFAGLLCLLVGSSVSLFVSRGVWIRITYPLLTLILGYMAVISLRYFATEAGKEKVEGESAETNRMLGLSFQSQGMLDMAFDKLRRVPVDEEMKPILYNLALDFERKRQLNKAAMVYEYIEKHDAAFRDVGRKKKKLMHASETMIYGDGFLGGGSSGDDLMATASDTRPTLGRYEVLKQLGKGAMGVVYLGQDPRINRTTAIKTFRFGDDVNPEALDDLKTKFFREAESAGTLSHPNIVTIYDAGDEQDLAYIAMEFLEGETFEKYTREGHLLPMIKVVDYLSDIASALDYAHQKGIVHRDIKPANVMLLKSGIVKITDFGIARITATSATQTGIVKGTPYYMSPEQISGTKVDGRSDIFSLGVMMFQLLTGHLPFRGDNPAALMHQIIHTPHPNPKSLNPKILSPLIKIVDRALEKDREKRYQRASQMENHLREFRRMIDTIVARKKAAQSA
jgi:CHASE2 domain-containing sensor protein/predicted Ser/Thr protein kinase